MNAKQKLHQAHLTEWAARFSDQKASGLTVRQWCELNNIGSFLLEKKNSQTEGEEMKEGKTEYLQIIQEPINRLSTTSAIFKGFAATIVSGIAALSYCDVNSTILGLSFVPVMLFALLDIYYLKLEKKYRFLFDQVRLDEHPIDFSMELTKDNKKATSRVWDCVKSPSIWLFYPAMIGILIVVFILKVKGVL